MPIHQTASQHPKQPRRLIALQRRRQALQMRLAGAGVDEIASALNITPGRVSQLIGEAMEELHDGIHADAEQLRELQRRDVMAAIATLRQSLSSHDAGERMAAADRLARLWARLSALYGLDAPTKSDVTSGGSAIDRIEIVHVYKGREDEDDGENNEAN